MEVQAHERRALRQVNAGLLLRILTLLVVESIALRFLKVSELVQRLTPRSIPLPHDLAEVQQVVRHLDGVLRRAPALPYGHCLLRSLTLYYFCTRLGYRVQISFGVQHSPQEALDAHAWLVLDGHSFMERGGLEQGFTALFHVPASPPARFGSKTRRGLVERLRDLLETLPLETRLLVQGARIQGDEASRALLERLVAEKPDWERVAARAEAHWIAPLLYRSLSQLPFAPLVPRAVLSRLSSRYLANTASNLLWQHELVRITADFSEAGIKTVLLKGAALLYTVYDDPGLRQLRDLDLLVHPRDLPAAEQRLLTLGYEPADARFPRGTWPHEWYEKKYRRRSQAGRETVVEIHWQLANPRAPFRIQLEELLEASRPVGADGIGAWVLSHHHQLLHLSTHLAHNDGFGVGLSRLSDVHETVERLGRSLDWVQLDGAARRFRASLCLRYSLAVAGALFGTNLPPGFLEDSGGPHLKLALAEAALLRVVANDLDPNPLPSTLAKLVSTDRIDLPALLQLLLAGHPREIRADRLLQPSRWLRALRYARVMR